MILGMTETLIHTDLEKKSLPHQTPTPSGIFMDPVQPSGNPLYADGHTKKTIQMVRIHWG